MVVRTRAATVSMWAPESGERQNAEGTERSAEDAENDS
jgi:hypothetical protein